MTPVVQLTDERLVVDVVLLILVVVPGRFRWKFVSPNSISSLLNPSFECTKFKNQLIIEN